MPAPARPKIYHIVHVDRLPSIIASGGLISDAQMVNHQGAGTTIGLGNIKQRRLNDLTLDSHPGLYVGECVPFYFCPRSIMLYLIHKRNSELTYLGGQGPIVHLEADLHDSVQWAQQSNLRWAFTLSNAGSYFFEDRNDLNKLNEIDWQAVQANSWSGKKDGKQAEFLLEETFSWDLIERIGVYSQGILAQVMATLAQVAHKPSVQVIPRWYY